LWNTDSTNAEFASANQQTHRRLRPEFLIEIFDLRLFQ